MRLIRRPARKLSALKKFVGFVMGELTIDRSDGGSTLKILVEKKNLAVVEVADADAD